jgi:hypothetical protein
MERDAFVAQLPEIYRSLRAYARWARCRDVEDVVQEAVMVTWAQVATIKGWLPIFERAAREVEQGMAATETRQWRTSQIKEKLGTLRWYGSGDEAFHVVSAFAEESSADLCQVCGRPGRLRNDQSWILTLCDEHHALDAAGGGAVIGRLSYPERSER